MSEGVEWGIHCCVTLAWLGGEAPVPAARLAERFQLPPAYLNKCLQALGRAGILTSIPGARGGFLLARAPGRITLLDIVTAIEGTEEAFRCTEIRQRCAEANPSSREFLRPCAIAAAMHKAEAAWRRELAAQTVADLMTAAPRSAMEGTLRWFGRDRRS